MVADFGYDFGKPLTAYGLSDYEMGYVQRVAAEWQSPGSIGRELATLASSGLVTDDLGSDVERTINQAVNAGPVSGETLAGIFDLQSVCALLSIELSNIPESVVL